jgi:transposase
MFTRISRIKMGKKLYKYVRIVESYRENGKKKQRVIANLGTVESLQGKADNIVEKLRDYCQTKYVKPGEIKGEETPLWGTILVARKLWNDLGLDQIIKKNCPKSKKGPAIEETAFVLAANSLLNPSSEHGLAWWLDKSYVCDSRGKRFLPEWRDNVTRDDRVRIKWKQLKLWYRSLDRLFKAKDFIEKDIYLGLRDLFGLKVDIVFYDITSLYFEGEGPDGLAEYGKSKDGKNRNRQILLGVVMASGWPVAHHVFNGSTGEVTTLPEVIGDLKNRFQIEKVIFVGDSIFGSKKNLNYLTAEEYKYIAAMKRRRNKETEEVLKKIKKNGWEECGNSTEVQEIEITEDVRYFAARSEERQQYERGIRLNNMKSTKKDLEALKKSVEKGKTKSREKIGYRVSSILKRVKGYRYFSWEITPKGEFKYWEDPKKMKKEKQIEGVYLLKSNDKTIKPPDVVKAYKELSNVEEAFREFKDVLEGRPIWHRAKHRVKAHVFVRALGYLLDTALRKALKKNNVYLTVEEAIKALEQVTIADLRLKGECHQIVAGTNKRYVKSILNAVGLTGYKYLLPSQISSHRGRKVAF